MNLLLVGSRDTGGGATAAALRLFQGLRKQGASPRMLVKEAISGQPGVVPLEIHKNVDLRRAINWYWMAQHNLIDLRRSPESNSWFSLPYPGFDLSDIPLVKDADVINLHWVAHFQSVESISCLLDTGKPVVWTLHDQNPFSGGCHYTGGCRGYTRACLKCPQLQNDRFAIPAAVLANKVKRWKGNLHLVAPSHWMADCARKSRVLGDRPIHVIPNSLDTRLFIPRSREVERKRLGIPVDSTCIMFIAEVHGELRKGFRELIQALEKCAAHPHFSRRVAAGKIRLVTVGRDIGSIAGLGLPVRALGYVKDEAQMARIYAAADLFVLPSLEDNLPNTVLEAMACAVPVVAFAVGGVPDMVTDGETGFLCTPGDTDAMADAILRLVADDNLRLHMGRIARETVESRYRLKDQASAYLELFRSLVTSNSGKRNEWVVPERARLTDWTPHVDPALLPMLRAAGQKHMLHRMRRGLKKSNPATAAEFFARDVKARLLTRESTFFSGFLYRLLRWIWRRFRKISEWLR